MEIFGAWLFVIGIVLFPIIFITHLILDIKYTDDFAIRDFIFDIAMWCNLFCWAFIAGGILLVHFF